MSDNTMQEMLATSHMDGGSAEYLENLYESYLADPSSVDGKWQSYFATLPEVASNHQEVSHAQIRDQFRELASMRSPKSGNGALSAATPSLEKKQAHVLQLINAYRTHGHHRANLDPLNMTHRRRVPDLELATHHLSAADAETVFSTESHLSKNGAKLKEIEAALQRSYCGHIGYEFMHITKQEETLWLQQQIESVQSTSKYSAELKKQTLKQLTQADGLEKYLGTRYVGQKRFSLEGGDSFIPLIHTILQEGHQDGLSECIIGMAHRGRLNLLVNVMGKSPEKLFGEFEGRMETSKTGDVKYHMGFSSDITFKDKQGTMHLALAFNPSHLEIIAPVVEGSVRARLFRHKDIVHKKTVLPLIVHGDAAFAGQGVVMETMNFSQAPGYCTGGTVHIVINNQIGFTTSNPLDARSTLYCTDVAKMVQAPVIHVNGNDPEAVIFAAQLALRYRMKFHKDVVVDLVCYRRHGHNEADEPAVTQPMMYEVIRSMPTPREMYAAQLIKEGIVTQADADSWVEEYRATLDRGESVVETVQQTKLAPYQADWTPYLETRWRDSTKTGVPMKDILQVAKKLLTVPKGFTQHPAVAKLWDDRQKMTDGALEMNWGYAEMMAYATLLNDGFGVRLSGQDVGRGTFAHRHAVLHDYKNGHTLLTLHQITEKGDDVNVIDSILSEEAVLGFEYGYAATDPKTLVIWEAQFGDFANGAQVVIDQFISSGEQKWGRLCGLVMLLPHGFEGMGPEHSSARLERYLQLCAQRNMQVCVPTTPAQIYHMLRRQMVRPYRKPLIVMTPKSLLRHKLVTSPLQDLVDGKFHLVIPEIDDLPVKDIKRVIVCSGKVYYDLLQTRRDNKQTNVAIIRVEQLYPFPKKELEAQLAQYAHVKQVIWCQEEPRNQGAWYPSRHNVEACLQENQTLQYAGRDYFAAPAVGNAGLHAKQQRELVAQALQVE